jgi:hypothetical protein
VAEHSVFGGAAPPWEPTSALDDPVALGSSFYSLAETWFAIGARIRIPAGDSGLYPATVTLELRFAATFALVDLSTAPDATATVTIADGWCTGLFGGVPLSFAPGTVAWITLAAGSTRYPFVPVASVGLGPVQASDLSDLFLSEAGTTPGIEQPRSAFRYGAGATQLSQDWYGVDLLVSDGQVAGDVTIVSAGEIVTTGEVAVTGQAQITATTAIGATGAIDGSSGAGIAEVVSVTASGAVTQRPSNAGGLTYTIELLSDILELLTTEESEGGCALPCFCRVAVYPGLEVPWDSCTTGGSCGECDGQLYAAIQSVERVPGDGVGACKTYNFNAIVGAVRCAAKLKDDDLDPFPSVEAVQNDAIRQARDADGIRYAIECCPTRPQRLKDAGIVLERWDALGPQDCVGGAWTIRGRFDVCC